MSVRGIFTSHAGLLGERQTDLAGRVLQLGWAGTAPLLALSSGMPSEPVRDTSYAWIEDSHISGNTTVKATVDAAATQVNVLDANLYVPHTILMNEVTGEYMLVTAVAGNTLTVMRGIVGTTAASLSSGDTLQSVGTAHPEAGGKPDPVSQQGEEFTNYVQIFKNGWAISGTAKAVKFATGSKLAYNREMCANYHAEDIERAFLFGRKGVMPFQGKQLRLTNGILAQIEQYGGLVESAATDGNNGDLSMRDLQDFFRRIFDVQIKGLPNERIVFTGSGLMQVIQDMVLQDGTYNIKQGESKFGISVWEIAGFNHNVKFMTHPLMSENRLWSHEMYVLHPGTIKRRVLRDSWSQEFTAGANTNNGIDADEGFVAIEMGFELKGARAQGIMRNVQNAVKSYQ